MKNKEFIPGERFSIIPEFPDYEVTDYGRVYSIKTSKFLSLVDNGTGYLKVGLCKKGKKYQKCVHKLVAEAFCPNPNNYHEVDHIYHNTHDNYFEHLRWVSHKENMRNRTDNKAVDQYDLNGNFIKHFDYMADIEAELDITHSQLSHVCQCCKGNRKSAYGYKWRYSECQEEELHENS